MYWCDVMPEKRPAEWEDEEFQDYLDEIYGEVDICGCTYSAGYALRELDPTAFRVAQSEVENPKEVYICPECGAEHEEETDAKECCLSCYECPECGEEYTTEEEAQECCNDVCCGAMED